VSSKSKLLFYVRLESGIKMKRRTRSQTQEPEFKNEPSSQALSKKRRGPASRSGSSVKKKSRTTSETPSPQLDIGRAMSPLRTPSVMLLLMIMMPIYLYKLIPLWSYFLPTISPIEACVVLATCNRSHHFFSPHSSHLVLLFALLSIDE